MKQKRFLQLAVVFAAVYFFSLNGLAALPNLSLNFLLKNQMKLSASQMAYFQAVILLAWVIKPLWGFISDCFPLWGSRRKSYLILSSLLAGLAWVLLAATKQYTAGTLLAVISVCYMAYAFQDVVTDGLMVELGKPFDLTGKFQAIQWAAVYTAMILTSFTGGFVSDLTQKGRMPYQTVFGITAVFPVLTVLIAGFLIHEEKNQHPEKEAGLSLRQIFKEKDIWILSLFLFFWNFSPSFGAPFFYYSVDTLKFSGSFLGILQGSASAAALAGSIFYGKYADRYPLRKFLLFAVFAGTFMILSNFVYFIPPLIARPVLLKSIAIATNLLFGVFNTLIFLALLNLSAKVSPQYAGGTVFAFLMSFYNLGLMGSSAFGGFLFPWVGLQWLILISAVFSLFSLLFLPFLPVKEDLTPFEHWIRKVLKP